LEKPVSQETDKVFGKIVTPEGWVVVLKAESSRLDGYGCLDIDWEDLSEQYLGRHIYCVGYFGQNRYNKCREQCALGQQPLLINCWCFQLLITAISNKAAKLFEMSIVFDSVATALGREREGRRPQRGRTAGPPKERSRLLLLSRRPLFNTANVFIACAYSVFFVCN